MAGLAVGVRGGPEVLTSQSAQGGLYPSVYLWGWAAAAVGLERPAVPAAMEALTLFFRRARPGREDQGGVLLAPQERTAGMRRTAERLSLAAVVVAALMARPKQPFRLRSRPVVTAAMAAMA